MCDPIGYKLQRAIQNNPYTYEGMKETEEYLVKNEGTTYGWYWTQNGKPIAFGTCQKRKKSNQKGKE